MAGGHGGRRPGAGRKPGSGNVAIANTKAREELLAQVPELSDVVKQTTPLQRLELLAMIYFQKFIEAQESGEPGALKWLELSGTWSEKTAPFFHGKRSHVTVDDQRDEDAPKTVDDLKASVFGSAPTPKKPTDGLH